MTGDREPSPAEEEHVSRLLAEAGGPVPTPAAVVARLDDVLAGLVAERTPTAGLTAEGGRADDVADELAEARARRRRWPQVLLAASAVVIGGYGATAVLGQGSLSGSDDSGAGAGEAAVEGLSGGDTSSRAGGDAGGGDGRLLTERRVELPPLRLRSDRLDDDVRRVLLRAETAGTADQETFKDGASAGDGCVPPGLGPSDSWYVVRFDGGRATLVTGPETGGRVAATVFSCAGQVLAETAVVAP